MRMRPYRDIKSDQRLNSQPLLQFRAGWAMADDPMVAHHIDSSSDHITHRVQDLVYDAEPPSHPSLFNLLFVLFRSVNYHRIRSRAQYLRDIHACVLRE